MQTLNLFCLSFEEQAGLLDPPAQKTTRAHHIDICTSEIGVVTIWYWLTGRLKLVITARYIWEGEGGTEMKYHALFPLVTISQAVCSYNSVWYFQISAMHASSMEGGCVCLRFTKRMCGEHPICRDSVNRYNLSSEHPVIPFWYFSRLYYAAIGCLGIPYYLVFGDRAVHKKKLAYFVLRRFRNERVCLLLYSRPGAPVGAISWRSKSQ